MDEMIFFSDAKDNVIRYFEQEFENFPPLLMSHFLNQFNDLMNYSEEGKMIKPNIVFTDNIESITRSISKSYALTIFEDKEPNLFNSRLKSLLAIVQHDWCIFIDIKENKITYGLVMSYASIKDKNLISSIETNTTLKDKPIKVHAVIARPLTIYSMSLHSISGNRLIVNYSLDKTKSNIFRTEIAELIDVIFSKLRTTQRKLQDMKYMYTNIFTDVLSYVHGSICVVVDKDYKDNGMFEDGIWLKEPISFSKLFTQSTSYNEAKLRAFSNLFINMLNFDGITIIDNQGRLRAYNVFVEPNNKKVDYIVGGARKRAAFHILSSKKKGILGVYFQSHEGEVFFQETKSSVSNRANQKTNTTKENKENTTKDLTKEAIKDKEQTKDMTKDSIKDKEQQKNQVESEQHPSLLENTKSIQDKSN